MKYHALFVIFEEAAKFAIAIGGALRVNVCVGMNVNRSLIVFEMILFAQLESIQFEKDCLFNLL